MIERISFHTTKFFWNAVVLKDYGIQISVSTLLSSSETNGLLYDTEKAEKSFHTTKFFWNSNFSK